MTTNKDQFRTAVTAAVRKLRKSAELEIADDEAFGLAGLDSLDAMNLILEVEGALGVNFGEITIGTSDTIETFFERVSVDSERA